MTRAEIELLRRAAGANAPALLATLKQPPTTWRLKLLGCAAEGVWAQPADQDAKQIDELIASSSAVGIFFLSPAGPAAFTTQILRRGTYSGPQTEVATAGLLLRAPDRLHTFERRADRRVLVPDTVKLHVRLVRRSRRGGGREIQAKVWDIGRFGAGFVHPYDRSLLEMKLGEPLRTTIFFRGQTIELDGSLRWVKPNSARLLWLGVSFDKAEPSALAALAIIVEELDKLAEKLRPTDRAA